jgi:hypothetical protein
MSKAALQDRVLRVQLSKQAEGMTDLHSEPVCNIVILNFNGKGFLVRCLRSIKNLEYNNYNVIVVDNAS